MNTKNLLEGEWHFLYSETYRNDRWELYQRIENDSLHWIFSPMQEGLLGLEGALIEREKGDKETQTTYTFDAETNPTGQNAEKCGNSLIIRLICSSLRRSAFCGNGKFVQHIAEFPLRMRYLFWDG